MHQSSVLSQTDSWSVDRHSTMSPPAGCSFALCTQDVLESAVPTLTELRNVHLNPDLSAAEHTERPSLTRFVALRSAVVSSVWGRHQSVVPLMPAGLRELTLVAVPDSTWSAAHTCAAVTPVIVRSHHRW